MLGSLVSNKQGSGPVSFNKQASLILLQRTIQESFKFISYDSISDFLQSFNVDSPSTGIQIEDHLPIHLRWINRHSDTTLVTFSAAITRRTVTEVPVFTGWGVTKHLNSNVLMISDPSLILDINLNLGWYLGSAHQSDLADKITDILTVFAKTQRLVLFGASGGGFASLTQAARIPGSTALISNPQTNITKFSYYPAYKQSAWPGFETPQVETSVIDTYRQPVDTRIIYIQNRQDTDHFEHHYYPFIGACSLSNQVLPLTPDLGEGHIGPNPETFTRLLTEVTERYEWGALCGAISAIPLYSTKTAPQL